MPAHLTANFLEGEAEAASTRQSILNPEHHEPSNKGRDFRVIDLAPSLSSFLWKGPRSENTAVLLLDASKFRLERVQYGRQEGVNDLMASGKEKKGKGGGKHAMCYWFIQLGRDLRLT